MSVGPRWPFKDAACFGAALCLAAQWILLRATHVPLSAGQTALLSGLGIFGAAFLLSWAAELAQLEMSQALALAFLALVAVLPEYAVDMYLAWTAAKDPSYTAYAAANMTGSNRLLIGLGWPVVLLCCWGASRRRQIALEPGQRIELVTLLVATLYAFLIPLKRSLSLWDTAILVSLFAVYLMQSARAAHEESELEGPPARFALLPRRWRRLLTLALFLVPGYTIFIAAKPFADGLLASARQWGLDEFILIQWLAPLASESPEFIVAILFAVKGNATGGLGTLISSKVNQWTLLIGMLPLAYAVSGGHPGAMPLDGRQAEEIFLTAAQSLLAIILLADHSFGVWDALLLAGLFLTQLCLTTTWVRLVYAVGYLLLSLAYLCRRGRRRSVGLLLRQGWQPGSSSRAT